MSDTRPAPPPSAPDRGMRWVLLLIAVSLLWYLLADRFTPYTQQARLQAYVVPVAAEVAGQIKRVAVGNNQEVRQGDVLFELDQRTVPHCLGPRRSRSRYRAPADRRQYRWH